MSDLQNKILQYLKNTNEATVFEIMNRADFYPYGGPNQVREMLSGMVKAGLIKRGSPSNYRIATKHADDKQINLF